MRRLALVLGSLFIFTAPAAWSAQNVANTRHNLSAGGPGTVKSGSVNQICVFCHTPHNALPAAQLWNRPDSGATYTPYDSSTLVAPTPGQPTGKSRLCLSCHDGTVALGALQKPPAGNDLGSTFLTAADRGFLDTDLSDDHPISFAYDAALHGLNPELADPSTIGLPLEGDQLQCTTCHDPHEADLKPFLQKTTVNGELCTTCHQRADSWPTSAHATSTSAVTASDLPWRRPEWVAPTVAGNACLSCHTPHSAERPQRLIAKAGGNTCYGCHDGTPAVDIATDFAGVGKHPVDDPIYAGIHDAAKLEDPATMPLHVECMDCHNPHTVTTGEPPMISFNPNDLGAAHTNPPLANAVIQGATGLDLNGNPLTSVTNQYELCFKCHGRPGQNTCGTTRCGAAKSHDMYRADMVTDAPLNGGLLTNLSIRDRVYSATPGLLSWHPIESNNPANDSEVPSLRTDIPLNTSTSLIYCTDCHNSDRSQAAGGTGPNGPHGSAVEGLLAQGYVLDINSTASDTASYALCYKCHDELTIRSTASFPKHDAHLGNRQGSCMKCHDPHGSHHAGRLINFLWQSDGQVVIDCDGRGRQTGTCDGTYPKPTWVDTGSFTGECWLNCHGTGHAGKTY